MQVKFSTLDLLKEQFNSTHGALRESLLSHICRKKIKESTEGTAEKQDAQWCKLVKGKDNLAIDILMFSHKIILLAASAFKAKDAIVIVAASAASEMTVADIKKQLQEVHRIEFDRGENVLCSILPRDRGDRLENWPKLEDDNARLKLGSELIVFNPKELVKLPSVLFEPPAESIEIDGQQQIPVNVEVNTISKVDTQFLELQLPQGCTALQLKQELAALGFGWAVDSSKVIGSGNKVIKDESVIPATCKVVQMAPSETCIQTPFNLLHLIHVCSRVTVFCSGGRRSCPLERKHGKISRKYDVAEKHKTSIVIHSVNVSSAAERAVHLHLSRFI